MTDRRRGRDPYDDPRYPRQRDTYPEPGYDDEPRSGRDPGFDDRDVAYDDVDLADGGEDRGRRISPGAVFLVVAVIGSVAFMAYFFTVREATQIPLLASGAVVLAIVFAALAAYCLRTVWRASTQGAGAGRLMVTAIVGGIAAIAAAGFAAGSIILIQVSMLA